LHAAKYKSNALKYSMRTRGLKDSESYMSDAERYTYIRRLNHNDRHPHQD
jgi:hypothetical protein